MAGNIVFGEDMTNKQDNENCERCGCLVQGFESVSFGSENAKELLCLKCYNQTVSDMFGVGFQHQDFPPVTLQDTDGGDHEFHFATRLLGDMLIIEALEMKDGEPDGYRFSVMGDPDEGSLKLYMSLFTRVCHALGRKHIELGNLGWRITDDDVVLARIDSDPEIEYDRVPLLVIDGKDITWEEFGRMLMTYEGFNFRLEIKDSTKDLT